MKLVVGLGNPGSKYEGTRHNIGFEVLAVLARKWNAGRPKSKFKAEVVELEIAGHKVLLLSPLTYMNLSGQSIRAAVDFFKVELKDLMVICDDMALELGRLRIKGSGSAGGQNGLANTIEQLGTENFPRLRVGIGRPPVSLTSADYVLQTFSKRERPEVDLVVQKSADAVEMWIRQDISAAMSRYNVDPNAQINAQIKAEVKAEVKQKVQKARSEKNKENQTENLQQKQQDSSHQNYETDNQTKIENQTKE